MREFQRAFEEALTGGYLKDPRVSAEVLNFRPFYILGEVEAPGEYPYGDGLAGGPPSSGGGGGGGSDYDI